MQACISKSLVGLRPPVSLPTRKIGNQFLISVRAQRQNLVPTRRQIFQIHAESTTAPPEQPSGTASIPQTFVRLASAAIRPAIICCLAAAAFALISPSALAAAKKAQVAAATNASVSSGGLTAVAKAALDFILHLDVHLGDIIAKFGNTTYAILFAIVFAETGLVVTPFLPGDSLLFATGALAALGKLNILALMGVYITAAILGDAVNYASKKEEILLDILLHGYGYFCWDKDALVQLNLVT